MATIFISYRRADSASETGRLYDRLVERYGRMQVFKDVDSIPAGVNFPEYIAESIQASDVALVVIGPRWLSASSGFAQRRLDDPADFVRVEIETALKLGVAVIPVLVGGATLPPARRLPQALRPLLRQNGLLLRQDPDFARDVERIIEAIDYWQAQPRRPLPTPTPEPVVTLTPASSPAPTAGAPSIVAPTAPTRVATRSQPPSRAAQARVRPPLRRAPWLAFGSALLLLAIAATLISSKLGLAQLSASNLQATQTISAQRTQAAETLATSIARASHAYTGLIGPCDTAIAHQFDMTQNQFYWQIVPPGSERCETDGATARIYGSNDTRNQPTLTFWGVPDYATDGSNGFPTNFRLTMDIAFTRSDPSGKNSAYCFDTFVGAVTPNAPGQLRFCRDGTYTVSSDTHGGSASQPYHLGSGPNQVTITIQNQQMSMALNGATVISGSQMAQTLSTIEFELEGAAGDDVALTNFALTPQQT